MVDNTPKIEVLLEEVIKRKGSDLHFEVGLPPVIRIDGNLLPLPTYQPLNEKQVETLVFGLLDEDQKQILLRDKEFDFSFAFGDLGRFRVNAYHERGNLAAAMRLISNEIKTIESLGLPPVINKFSDFPRGLVLVTGPTGSGKSSTLADQQRCAKY
jgi:twitching motility protein PilT